MTNNKCDNPYPYFVFEKKHEDNDLCHQAGLQQDIFQSFLSFTGWNRPVARTSKRWKEGWTGAAYFWHHPNGKGPFAAGRLQKDVSCSRRSFVTTHLWACLPFSELCSSGAVVKLWPWASCQRGTSHSPPTAANPQSAVECEIYARVCVCRLLACAVTVIKR